MLHSVEANDLKRFKGSINLTEHETFELNNKSCDLKLSVSYVPLIKEMKTSKKYGGYDKNWVSLG